MTATSKEQLRFRGHVVITGELECRSGLHVGGNRDSLTLGAADTPVARDPATQLPIVPGSSLKGRMRALLETLRGRVRFERGDTPAADEPDAIDLLFGVPSGRRRVGPTRLVVRDGMAIEPATVDWWRALDTDGVGTEVKAETAINRVTAAAHPRQIERVLAGSRFSLEFVLNVYDLWDDEERLIGDLLAALALLEDNYLGGHGSRGYGRVAIRLHEQPAVVTTRDYENGTRRSRPSGDLKTLDDIDAAAWVAAAGREAESRRLKQVYLKPRGRLPGELRSDTLFGLIAVGVREVHGREAVDRFLAPLFEEGAEPPLLLTSAFPYVTRDGARVHYFPAPIDRAAPGVRSLIEDRELLALVAGRDVESRSVEPGRPDGWFFLAQGRGETLLEGALGYLEQSGFGGRASSGGGAFEVELCEAEFLRTAQPGRARSAAVALPADAAGGERDRRRRGGRRGALPGLPSSGIHRSRPLPDRRAAQARGGDDDGGLGPPRHLLDARHVARRRSGG